MKRIFVFAASVSLSAALVSAAFAESNGPNPFGDNMPNQNVVQPEQSRGQLGGLASGAPSFASNLRDLRGPGTAAAAQAQIAQQPAGQNIAQQQTVVQNQAVAVQKQTITTIQSFHQLGMVIHHCILHTPHKFQAGASPFAPFGNPVSFTPAVAKTPGDLEIAAVGMVADATPEQGPLYRITIRNNSETPSRQFEVSLIAVRGQLNHSSPVVSVHVDEIAAGGVHEIDVQLPLGVMSLSLNNQAAPFESLVVAIDSFDQLIEINELNNVAILTRGEIAIIETATAETTVTAPAAAPNAAAPNAAAPGTTSPIDAELDDDNSAAPGTESAAPAPGDSTLSAPSQQNVAPPAQQNVAPQGAPSGNAAPNPAPNAGPSPAPNAAPNVAPAEANPQTGSSTGLEALVPKTSGM